MARHIAWIGHQELERAMDLATQARDAYELAKVCAEVAIRIAVEYQKIDSEPITDLHF